MSPGFMPNTPDVTSHPDCNFHGSHPYAPSLDHNTHLTNLVIHQSHPCILHVL